MLVSMSVDQSPLRVYVTVRGVLPTKRLWGALSDFICHEEFGIQHLVVSEHIKKL
jgi:hypothetical protein